MLLVQIGGSGRGSGKTAIGCALMQAIPERRWAAVKISPHAHELSEGILEETDAGADKDTGRYLKTGAKRAFLITASAHDAAQEMIRKVRELASGCDAMLVESGLFDIAELASEQDARVVLLVLSGDAAGWKPGTLERARFADALVLADDANTTHLPEELRGLRTFELPRGIWESGELAEFVRDRLSRAI